MDNENRFRMSWIVLVFLGGCTVSPPKVENVYQGLQSEEPQVRAEAVLQAGNSGNVRAVPLLIDRLTDNAPEVRMLAGVALRKITGEDFGWRAWDSFSRRQQAIARWRAWWRETHAPERPVSTDPPVGMVE